MKLWLENIAVAMLPSMENVNIMTSVLITAARFFQLLFAAVWLAAQPLD
jgi:hypothetical protein